MENVCNSTNEPMVIGNQIGEGLITKAVIDLKFLL